MTQEKMVNVPIVKVDPQKKMEWLKFGMGTKQFNTKISFHQIGQ
jgi:hypothetical protein